MEPQTIHYAKLITLEEQKWTIIKLHLQAFDSADTIAETTTFMQTLFLQLAK
jgi:hypothetical protein